MAPIIITSCTPRAGFEYFENSYFSLECPNYYKFSYYKLSEKYEETDNLLSDYLEVEFTGWRRSLISVTIRQLGTDNNKNASEIFETIVNDAKTSSDSYVTGKKVVNGIQADYLKSVRIEDIPITISNEEYQQSELSFRSVVFDYSGYIWQISMYWDYLFESPIIQEDFEHIIDTFNIYEDNL